MADQTPVVGQIVLYHLSRIQGGAVVPAVVTRVNEDETVNLTVFTDGPANMWEPRIHARIHAHVEAKDAPQALEPDPGCYLPLPDAGAVAKAKADAKSAAAKAEAERAARQQAEAKAAEDAKAEPVKQ